MELNLLFIYFYILKKLSAEASLTAVKLIFYTLVVFLLWSGDITTLEMRVWLSASLSAK